MRRPVAAEGPQRARARKTIRVWLIPIVTGFVFVVLCAGQLSARAPARRIISLVPALTEMLFAIGAGPQVVAVSSFDTDPPPVNQLPKVGALLDPDVERILSLQPDLVLIYASQVDLLQQLARADIAAFSYRHGGLAHITNTIRSLGDRTGHAREAAQVADDLERRLQHIRTLVASRPKLRTMLVFGRQAQSLRQIYVSGGRGFLHDLLDTAGGINVFADIGTESVEASTELVLARAPDVILELRVTDIPSADEMANEIASWRPIASVPAVRAGRVHILTGRDLVVPGPRVADAAERMARALHPESFK
ncbi:MAG: ABC transporter substrate-binding protein [Vicinamibacterales bacterium]